MKRRALLLSTASLAAVSGCFGGQEQISNDEHAENTVDEISTDLDVDEWELEDGTLIVRYQTTGSISTDIEWLGEEHSTAVDEGLEADLEATALGASNEFTFTISRTLAKKYADGELTQEEYIDEIASDLEDDD